MRHDLRRGALLIVAAGLIWQAVLFLTGGLGGVIVLLSRDHAKQAVAAKDLSS